MPASLVSRTIPSEAGTYPCLCGTRVPSGTPPCINEPLVDMAGCEFCHSRQEKGEAVSGMNFAGGEVFRVGEFEVASANITADHILRCTNLLRVIPFCHLHIMQPRQNHFVIFLTHQDQTTRRLPSLYSSYNHVQ